MKKSKRRKTPVVRFHTDWRLTVSLVVVTVLANYAWNQLNNHALHQQAQLLEVPELIEEVDTPQPTTVPEITDDPGEGSTRPIPPSAVLREIKIEGPVDAIVGDAVHLKVRAEGPVVNYAWTISPEREGLYVLDDGSEAIFTDRNSDEYTVYVSAVDGIGNIEQDTYTFNLVDKKESLSLRNLSEANPDPTVPELIDYYVTEVQSPAKESEVIIISQTFRQTSNLLRTGSIGPGANILGNMQKGLEVTMGPQAFAKWQIFFTRLETLLSEYASKGYLNTREAWINTLDNLAAVLESRGDRKNSLQ